MKPSDILSMSDRSLDEIVKCMGFKTKAGIYLLLKRALAGRVSVNKLRKLSACMDINLINLVSIMYQTDYERWLAAHEHETIMILERMNKKNPDLAFAYLLELQAKGKATPGIIRWANENLHP